MIAKSRVSSVAVAGLSLSVLISLPACGGSGSSSKEKGDFSGVGANSPIHVEGLAGRFSLTPQEANAANGATPPARLNTITQRNHFFRLEVPFRVSPGSLLDQSLPAFSYLNGNLVVTDDSGNHLPGVACINGVDAFGVDRSGDPGFPRDIGPNGQDRNLRHVNEDGLDVDVILYVSDRDADLSTISAFDGALAPESNTSGISTVKLNLKSLNSLTINGAWQIQVGGGTAGDTTPPEVVSVGFDTPEPGNPSVASVNTSFLVEFSEPMVPQSVGRSAALNGSPFNGNIPSAPYNPPFPPVILTVTTQASQIAVYMPFECQPLNSNNLSTYRLTPLVPLPASSSVQVRIFASINNAAVSPFDLWGNIHLSQDMDGDGRADDQVGNFSTGLGPAIVNIPVSPEVVYWLPNTGRGIGAVDLNGMGFNTNAPGANRNRPESAKIVTKLIVPGSSPPQQAYNTVSGIATLAHPCDAFLCIHNQFLYPVGLGSYAYGPGISPTWEDPADPGNPGTPLPGVNEGSSGMETLCRDSNGDVILTGRQSADVGNLADLQVGEFLDMIYHDTQNFWTDASFHVANYSLPIPGVTTLGRNTISDPPVPNPPPTRFWVGLSPVDTVIDQANPTSDAFLIEGDEPWLGVVPSTGKDWLQPNKINPFGPDETIFPHFTVGPGVQSSTQAFAFASRQQIGNFLYVTDQSNRMLHALNSNTMKPVASIPLPDPTGLGLAPNNELLFVTNFGEGTMSVINTNPLSPDFHTEIARLPVGGGPRAVSVQMDGEDVHVCNFNSNSIAIVSLADLTVRKTVTALINAPWDIHLTGRQLTPTSPNPYGFAAGIYFGYISNHGGDNLLIFESGPDGPQGIGYDNVLGEIPTGDEDPEIIEPRGLCGSPFQNPQALTAGGVYIAHRDLDGFGVVSHIQFTNQALYGPLPRQAPPGFFIPPGFLDRNFEITGQWGQTVNSRLRGNVPTDVTLADFDTQGYHGKPATFPNLSTGYLPPFSEKSGVINSHHFMRLVPNSAIPVYTPDRLYVAYADDDTIQVLDPNNPGLIMKTIEPNGGLGVKKLGAYWHQ